MFTDRSFSNTVGGSMLLALSHPFGLPPRFLFDGRRSLSLVLDRWLSAPQKCVFTANTEPAALKEVQMTRRIADRAGSRFPGNVSTHHTMSRVAGVGLLVLLWLVASPCIAQTLRTLASFNLANGNSPEGSLILSGSTLYGVTVFGGAYNHGTVFSIPTSGGAPTTLLSFNGTNGSEPYGDLTLSGATLYGTTNCGGTGNEGTVFSLPTSGGTPTVLTSFSLYNGANPRGSLTLSGSTLYGTTSAGGANYDGTVFSLPTSGGTATTLATFSSTIGRWPYGSLTLSDSTFYGITMSGGANGCGTVFSLPVSGGAPTILASFNGANGDIAHGSLILSGSTLYGMTSHGGANGVGTVFSLPISGGVPTTLLSFNGTNGAYPLGSLVLRGSTLYGMTFWGGAYQAGTIFSLNTDGTGYKDLLDFNIANGKSPCGSLTLDGSTLYGTTQQGGVYGYGTIFALDLPARNLTWNMTDGTWDKVSTNKPWTADGSSSQFSDYDNVTFNRASGGTVTVAAGVNPGSMTVSAPSGTYTFTGPIAAVGSLVKSGNGKAVFQGANTFTSATISGGAIETQASGALGAGPVTFTGSATWVASLCTQSHANAVSLDVNGTTISATGTGLTTLSGTISGGPLTKAGGGTLELTGVNTFTGTTNVVAGTLFGNIDSLPNAIALSNSANVNFNQNTDGTLFQSVSGNGTFTKSGAGVLSINTALTYTGATTVNAGTLRLVPGPTSAPAGAVLQLDASTLNLANGAAVNALADLSPSHNNAIANPAGADGSPTFNAGNSAAGLNGKGTIKFNGSQGLITTSNIGISGGQSRVVFAVMNRGTGSMVIQMGQSNWGGSFTLSSQPDHLCVPYVIGPGGVETTASRPVGVYEMYDALHTHNADGSGITSGYINGNLVGTYGNGSPDISTVNGPVQIGFVAAGSAVGELHSTGNLAELLVYNSALTTAQRQQVEAYLNYKWFSIGETSNLLPTATPVTVNANATLDINGISQTIGSLSGAGNVTLGGGSLTVASTTDSPFSGVISGNGGSLVKTGANALVLCGTNSYSGPTTISGGKLVVNGSLASPTVAVNGGAKVGGTGSLAGKVTVAGGNTASTQGGVSLVDAALGTITLSDPNTSDTALTLGGTSANTPSLLEFEVGQTADSVLLSMARLMVNPGGATINITPLDGLP